jgi:hypothetical protein
MRTLVPAFLLSGVLIMSISACARPAVESPASPGLGQGPIRWSGNLQPTQQRTGEMAPTGQIKAYGTVSLVASPTNQNRTRARITLSAPLQTPTALRWAILPDRCGSGSLPLVGFDHFPVLEVGSNGRGQLDTEVPMTIPTSGSYHVNIYWRGQQLTDVMTCANLRRQGSR